MKVIIDNDACPKIVRELIFTACTKRQIQVVLFSQSPSQVPKHSLIQSHTVGKGFDAADDAIVAAVESNDLVITADIPLADRIVKKGAFGLSPYGQQFDASNIADILSTRNLMQELRSAQQVTQGPSSFGSAEKKKFAEGLDRLLTKLNRK
jgi:uncharacterized protein